jgi:2-polyprenyl-6-hydroxyphenyl methylase/3-demethylubiquinone-9 3-methyltransferase
LIRCDRTKPVKPPATSINNRFYDDLGDAWWDPRGPVSGLHEMTPARCAYFDRVFREILGPEAPKTGRFVDVGCGGGILAESLAGLGYRVVGVDPSRPSLEEARRHAAKTGAPVEYREGSVYRLELETAGFDGVVISDVLEHLLDLPGAIAEMARVLKPGGVLAFDTVNRTWLSLFGAILVAQKLLRLIPDRTHDWRLFIQPEEMKRLLAGAGMALGEIRGLSPAGSLVALAARILRRRRFGPYEISGDVRLSYIGYAVRKAETPRGRAL